ncbi:MAG: LUD domain-containing protein [Clostridia bacterium]|nr:LUD domain-containing protein [Clostridia bacterium]
MPSGLVNSGVNPWAHGRKMMKFPKESFHKLWKTMEKTENPDSAVPYAEPKSKELKEHKFSPITYSDPVAQFAEAAEKISGAKVVTGPVPDDVKATKGEIAVAENGCIWIPQTTEDRSYLFASEHLDFAVSKADIVNNMHEAYDKIAASKTYFKKYKFGTFISGPSKTADIEGTLVYGAQAARSVTVYITD